MNSKLLLLLFFLCLLAVARTADADEKKTEQKEIEKKDDKTDVKTDDKTNTKTEDKVDSKNDKETDTKTDDNNEKEPNVKVLDEGGTGRIDNATNTNSTVDSCGTTGAQLGQINFSKPISRSIIIQSSNFTIIWYYNNLIADPSSYSYPSNFTISLFYEKDANTNSYSSSWKEPVWEKTISASETQEGPILTNNVKSIQWDWKVMYDENGKTSEGFRQPLKTYEKYKLRISGDGKDLQRNPDFNCFKEGDIMPGITQAFYIVENTDVPTYKPFNIADSAYIATCIKFSTQFILPIILSLIYLFMN